MKRTIFWTLVILCATVLIVRLAYQPLASWLGLQPRAGLKVISTPQAKILINGQGVGQTPFQNEGLKPEEYEIKLIADRAVWQGRVTLNTGTLSVINRELASSAASSSGEILTLAPGLGTVVTSNPTGSTVEVDGIPRGVTPLSISDLTPGEHTFIINHNGYLKRTIRASLPAKMSLNITVDLAAIEPDLTALTVTPVLASGQVIVKNTPTGFLRLRSKPSINGQELGRVKVGEQLILIEEGEEWMKVRSTSGIEGYVSADYVQKVDPSTILPNNK